MIDTHAHLDFSQFDPDREKIIFEAKASGVKRIINIGVDLKSSRKSLELAKKYPFVYATVGVHPHDAKTLDDGVLKNLEILAQNEKVVAIGEIGLDFYRNLSPKKIQIEAFEKQIDLAKKLNLPIVVHMRMPKVKRHQEIRNAYDDALNILKKNDVQKIGGVLHCFSGNQKQANFGLSLGFYLSFNGTLTYPKSKAKDIAKNTPIDFILTETDCPYLSPAPFRGKRNKPSYVRFVVEKLSEIFSDSSFQEVEEITEKNAFNLFGLGNR